MATEEIVDIEKTEMLLKNIEKFPHLAQYIEENNDLPSCFFEEEMFTLEEWKEELKRVAYERLGIELYLS